MFNLPEGTYSAFRLSPDGRTLAVMHRDAKTNQTYLARVGFDGSDFRRLHTIATSDVPSQTNSILWTTGGKAIQFKALGKTADSWQIMRLPADGGNPEFTGLEVNGLLWFDLNPDGSRMAFSHREPIASELWVLDNVPSPLKASR
jgi:hypothetical protein